MYAVQQKERERERTINCGVDSNSIKRVNQDIFEIQMKTMTFKGFFCQKQINKRQHVLVRPSCVFAFGPELMYELVNIE